MSTIDAVDCQNAKQRRADVLAHPTLNGIDYIEVDAADHRLLDVFFIKPVPPANPGNPADTADAYNLSTNPGAITVRGGVRIVGIVVSSVERRPEGSLRVTVSVPGDFSNYVLAIEAAELDPFLSRIEFSFMASCPVDFDCRRPVACPEPPLEEPLLDYRAKDYASFRQMLFELATRHNPGFVERNPADLGVALVELLAYTGDQLSYFQDAVANENTLAGARQRISARRHARLIDYRMHDGRNAFTWVALSVNAAAALPQGTRFITRILSPLGPAQELPGLVIDSALVTPDTLETDPALSGAVVFESSHDASFDPRNNQITIHTFGNEECCVDAGTREFFLFHVNPASGQAELPVLRAGDYLLIEEVRGPTSGLEADADPKHRQIVRIEGTPEVTVDPIYTDTLVNGALQRRLGAEPPLPLLRVRTRREDALRSPFCVTVRLPGGTTVRDVSVARGNLVLADHGMTLDEVHTLAAPVLGDAPFRLELRRAPLTLQIQPGTVHYDSATGHLLTSRHELDGDAREAKPAVALLIDFPTGTELWQPVPDLLDSTPFSRDFVAELDNDLRPVLRFGDGQYGREVAGATAFHAVYRVGSGALGNIGADALAHVCLAGPAAWIENIRNPIAATSGIEPETIEEVRRIAPQAFRAEQFRAVTEADYMEAAKKLPDVAGAAAEFRWTGSSYTVFVGVDPADPDDLIRGPGLPRLSERLELRVRAFLGQYRLAGYDLEIRAPKFVPLEIEIELCVAADHFRADVALAVRQALSPNRHPTGKPGFFHPDHFSFGDPVHLSALYAAIERVEGVDSVVVLRFQRAAERANGELERGILAMGPWEIAQLEDDPNFPENGVLGIRALGGKG